MILRLAIILMFIASVAAGGLALLNSQTAPVIAENKRIEQEQARKEVVETLSDSIRFEEISAEDGFTYWKAYNENGDHLGFATLAFGKGYSSTIETVCGFDKDFNISGLKVTFQQETPGLGTKIQEIKSGESDPWFLRQFKGLAAATVAVVQDRGTIDSVTGATISSRALANSVRVAAAQIKEAEENAPVASESAMTDSGVEDYEDMDLSEDSPALEFHDEEAGLESYDDEETE